MVAAHTLVFNGRGPAIRISPLKCEVEGDADRGGVDC